MNNINKFMLYIALFMAGSVIESQQNDPDEQDPISLNIINAMQECIKFNDLARIQLFAMKTVNYLTGNTDIIHDADAEIKRQGNLWSKTIKLIDESISNLREKHGSIKNNIPLQNLKTNPNTSKIEQFMIQMNEYKNAFASLLNEYIVHLGKLYEKKSGLLGGYRTNYYLSSRHDQSVAITPHEYPLLLQTLDDAAKQSNWGDEINLDLLSQQENGVTSSKNLKLNEIISAIRQVPLPVNFYTTATQIGAGVATAAAIGAGSFLWIQNNQ